MKLFGLKNCDTCRKALKMLSEAGKEPEFHDVRVDGVTRAYLTKWAKVAGWKALLNTRSATWRELSDSEKANCDNEDAAIALMEKHPTLIKRPVIEAGDKITVGWSAETKASLLD